MRYKKLIQQVNDVLKQDFNQSDFYDRVAASLFLFNLVRKYSIQLNNCDNNEFIKVVLNKTKDMISYESSLYKDLTVVGLNDFDFGTLTALFSLYGELDLLGLKGFLDEYFEDASSKNIDQNTSLDSIVNLSKEILSISENSSVLDLCSGYGRFLSNIKNTVDLTGIEINHTVRIVSKINFYFSNNIDNEIYPKILEGDALTFDFNNKKYDYIFCEAPLGLKLSPRFVDKMAENSFFPFISNTMSSAWLFVDQTLKALKENGKAVIVINNAPLYKQSDYEYRCSLAISGHIEMVIGLSEKLLSNTNIPINLLVLNKSKKNLSEIKFIDASGVFVEGRRFNTLIKENISNIMEMIKASSRFIDVGELEFNMYNLNPRNYESYIQVVNPIRIEDITTDVFRGVQINSKVLDKIVTKSEYTYKLLRLSDIDVYNVDLENLYKINVDHSRWDRYLLKEGDFVISAKGTIIKMAVLNNLYNEKIIPEGNLMVLRLKKDIINPFYLKIFFSSPIGQTIIDRMQYSSSVLSINKSTLSKIEITKLEMEEQEKLVEKYFDLISEYNYHLNKINELKLSLEYLYADDDLGGE